MGETLGDFDDVICPMPPTLPPASLVNYSRHVTDSSFWSRFGRWHPLRWDPSMHWQAPAARGWAKTNFQLVFVVRYMLCVLFMKGPTRSIQDDSCHSCSFPNVRPDLP